MIQTTSLHDILWHFVASLTPSPFEPEDEEDDENKGNKENVEQVMSDDESNQMQLYFYFVVVSSSNSEHCHTSSYRKETLAFVNTLSQTLSSQGRQLILSLTPSTASFRQSPIL